MRTAKKIFYIICFFILLTCILILALAMNPDWSKKLSDFLYGEESDAGEENTEDTTPLPQETDGPDSGESATGNETHITPEPLVTKEPSVTPIPDTEDPTESVKLNSYTISVQCPPGQISAYKEPITSNLQVPEEMSSLLGYVPVKATMSEITAAEAEALEAELSIGEDGGLLVFDQNIYPYYHMLQGAERELYKQIYANAFSLNARFKPCQKIYSTQIGRVMEAVFNDHPVLFWVDTAYSCKYDPDGKCIEITLQFNSTSQKLEQAQTTFKEKAEEIINGARALNSDYEKEKYVHDKLLTNVSYNKDATLNQSAYSALVNGQTVCAGYARAYQYLLQQLGIPCYYCTGYSGADHAWNVVKLHGDYYNVDVTWDDTNPHTYNYFNRSDEELSLTHVRKGLAVKLPACTGKLYSGLENGDSSNEETPETSELPYSQALGVYYDTLIKRISKMGKTSATYTDILAADTWKEIDEACNNGDHNLPQDELVRALQYWGANSCTITFTPEIINENAYNVTCTISVQ